MLKKHPWILWLSALVAIIASGVVLRVLLAWREMLTAAKVVDVATIVLASAWCHYGLHLRRDRIWASSQRLHLIASNLLWAAALIAHLGGHVTAAYNLLGIWTLTAIGIFGLWLIQQPVALGHPVASIARTFILQASRLHVVKFVIGLVVLLLILLPGRLDAAERLDYRVKFYLEWSMRLATFTLSILTAVLGCHTICSDLSRKQMFMLASKPVGRMQYLLGKWTGLMLLNIVLCAIMGTGVWLGARTLAAEPLPDRLSPGYAEARMHQRITFDEVLAARVTAYPMTADPAQLAAMIRGQFETLRQQFPESYPDRIEDLDAGRLNEIQGKAIAAWHTIAPLSSQVYYFDGFKPLADDFAAWLDKQREMKALFDQLKAERRDDEAAKVYEQARALPPPSQALKLRLKPKYANSSRDGMLHMVLRVSGQVIELDAMQNDTVRWIDIPLAAVSPEGRVEVAIANANLRNREATHQSAIVFDPYEDIEMLYSAGTFEGNLVRGVIVHWVRLSFLAMLSLAAGTLLGFPMACLTSIFIYSVAVFNAFAAESLANYTALDLKDKSKWQVFVAVLEGIWKAVTEGDLAALLKLVAKLIGDVTLLVVPSFGYYNSTPLIADGRMVPLQLVGESALWVGLVSGGLCLLIGWLIFRRREMARVTV